MFTGLVEELGTVQAVEPRPEGRRFWIAATTVLEGARIGDSIACSGCCLTVVAIEPGRFAVEAVPETLRVTTLGSWREGDGVNLERSLTLESRLGGHLVTGHVDDIGRITRWEPSGKDHVLEISVPAALRSSFVPKGSVAVDGISLTVSDVLPEGFRAWIIPHTYSATALRERKVGDAVNLETDLLGKYVTRFLDLRSPPPARRR